MPQVYVRYAETRAGRIALKYAADVSAVFSDEPLFVLLAYDVSAAEYLRQQVAGVDEASVAAVRDKVRDLIGEDREFYIHTFDEARGPDIPLSAIVVAHDGMVTDNRHVIFPANERGLFARRRGPILLTFSDGDTGLIAARVAFELIESAKRKGETFGDGGAEVIFYHTTWRHPEARSDEAIDQMCPEAVRVMLAVENAARERGITAKTVVETHDQVAQGVIEMVDKTGAVLIVMDRSEQVVQGSYVDRVLEQSPVPVFVADPLTDPICEPADDQAVEQLDRAREQELSNRRAPSPSRGLLALLRRAPVLNPVFVMSMVALMYVYKLVSKVVVGSWIASPTLVADGFHNAADFLQALIVIVVIMVALRPSSEKYHYGRQNVEWAASSLIGVLLFVTALKFILDCVVGFMSYAPGVDGVVRGFVPWLPTVEASNLTGSSFPWLLGVSLSSIALSFLVSKYQVFVGSRSGHQSMIADGEETRSDGWIETVTVVGLLFEYFTGWRAIEYALGLFVAYLICGTARELCQSGWQVMMQRSLGKDIEDALRKAIVTVPGVESVIDLKTFQVGHTAFVQVTIESMSRSAAIPYVLSAVRAAMSRCLLDPSLTFKGVQLDVNLERSDPAESRDGYAVTVDAESGRAWVAPSLVAATDLAVCDLEHGEIVRTKLIPLPERKQVPRLLLEKRLHRLFVMDPHDNGTQALMAALKAHASYTLRSEVLPDTTLERASTFTLSALNIRLHRKGSRTITRAAS